MSLGPSITVDPAFPENAVDVLFNKLLILDGIENVERRALDPVHPNASAGVFASGWSPTEWEIGAGDTMGQYQLFIQTLFKHTDQAEGRAISSKVVKSVRVMLYRDAALRLALGSLNETVLGVKERVLKWGVIHQRYTEASFRGEFCFVSSTSIRLDTEMTH